MDTGQDAVGGSLTIPVRMTMDDLRAGAAVSQGALVARLKAARPGPMRALLSQLGWGLLSGLGFIAIWNLAQSYGYFGGYEAFDSAFAGFLIGAGLAGIEAVVIQRRGARTAMELMVRTVFGADYATQQAETVTLSREGVAIWTGFGARSWPWSNVDILTETPTHVVLVSGHSEFFAIPRRDLDAAQARRLAEIVAWHARQATA